MRLFIAVVAAMALNCRASYSDFGIPYSQATVSVKAFDIGHLTAPSSLVFAPVLPGQEVATGEMHSFLIEHGASNTRVLFDLGIRKDVQNFAPAIAGLFSSGLFQSQNATDIAKQLQQGGISLSSIDTVIWRSGVHKAHSGHN